MGCYTYPKIYMLKQIKNEEEERKDYKYLKTKKEK